MEETTIGERFVNSLLAQDWNGVRQHLAGDIRYRGVTTSTVTEVTGRDEAVAGLQIIFEDGDIVTDVETVMSERLPPVERVTYRFGTRVPATGVKRRAEQHVFITADESGYLERVDLICSGWLSPR